MAERIPLSRVYLGNPQRRLTTKITPTEARQGTGPRAMFWVLAASVTLAVIAGLLLGFGWISLT